LSVFVFLGTVNQPDDREHVAVATFPLTAKGCLSPPAHTSFLLLVGPLDTTLNRTIPLKSEFALPDFTWAVNTLAEPLLTGGCTRSFVRVLAAETVTLVDPVLPAKLPSPLYCPCTVYGEAAASNLAAGITQVALPWWLMVTGAGFLQLRRLPSCPVMVNATVPVGTEALVVTGATLAATVTPPPVVVALGVAVKAVVVPAVPVALALNGTIASEAMATRTLAPAAKAACLRRLLIIFRLPTSARGPPVAP
jgi:hypothetical protein